MSYFGYYTVDCLDCPPFELFSNGDTMGPDDVRRYEPFSLKLWCHYVRGASSILDIGAHVGVYAMAAASLRKDIPIHAFEPNPYTAARLRVNKFRNGFDRLEDHHLALTDYNGTIEISWFKKPGGHLSSGSGIGVNPGWEKAPAFSSTLDALNISCGTAGLVKIDVEGAELLTFRGMTKFLASKPIIILETFREDAPTPITAALAGYRYFLVDEKGFLSETPAVTRRSMKDESLNQLFLPPWAKLPEWATVPGAGPVSR